MHDTLTSSSVISHRLCTIPRRTMILDIQFCPPGPLFGGSIDQMWGVISIFVSASLDLCPPSLPSFVSMYGVLTVSGDIKKTSYAPKRSQNRDGRSRPSSRPPISTQYATRRHPHPTSRRSTISLFGENPRTLRDRRAGSDIRQSASLGISPNITSAPLIEQDRSLHHGLKP